MRNVQGRKKAKLSTGLFSSYPYFGEIAQFSNFLKLQAYILSFCDHFQRRRLVGDSGTVLRREVRGSDGRTGERGDEDEGEVGEEFGEGGTVRRGRGGKGGRNLGRKHSRASSLDRREIYQKYIHTDRSVHQVCIAKQIHPNSQAL